MKFLALLDPDPDRAALEYERLRARLIIFWDYRGFPAEAPALADVCFDRAVKQVDKIVASPLNYLYGVARNVFLEELKKPRRTELPTELPAPDSRAPDLLSECLEHCLKRLIPSERELITLYCAESGQAKIDRRSRMAADLGISKPALVMRAFKIKKRLRSCARRCAEAGGPGEVGRRRVDGP